MIRCESEPKTDAYLPLPETIMSFPKLCLVLALVIASSGSTTSAQGTTAFLTGEQTTGTTKQCFYDALGSAHTVTVSSIAICKQTIRVQSNPSRLPTAPSIPSVPTQSYVTAFKTGEQTTGMTKQCFYDGLGNVYTKTVSSVTLCPLTIRVSR